MGSPATKAMKTPLQQGESIVKEHAANLQKGIQTVGDKLRVTVTMCLNPRHGRRTAEPSPDHEPQ